MTACLLLCTITECASNGLEVVNGNEGAGFPSTLRARELLSHQCTANHDSDMLQPDHTANDPPATNSDVPVDGAEDLGR